MKMKDVTIYTDGSCLGNPGAGGWCAILIYNGKYKSISGGEEYTTNNRMELTAAVQALKALKEPCNVTLIADSKYVVDAIKQGWLKNWKAKGWINSKKKSIPNKDLWIEFDNLLMQHSVTFEWTKGHAENAFNNMCDEIARKEAMKY